MLIIDENPFTLQEVTLRRTHQLLRGLLEVAVPAQVSQKRCEMIQRIIAAHVWPESRQAAGSIIPQFASLFRKLLIRSQKRRIVGHNRPVVPLNVQQLPKLFGIKLYHWKLEDPHRRSAESRLPRSTFP
ncbi:hypothetical protein A1D31_38245 [Bradyrhizobium liaoningense]|nr:hypothetical protein A1D31_38245 [Bradyrhizobium liaoningense]